MKPKKIEINYVYFLFFLSLSGFFSILTVLDHQKGTLLSSFFFVIYSIIEVFLETALIAFLAYIFEKYFNKYFFYLFIGLSFIFFIRNVVNFFTIKLMDMTIWDGLSISFDEDLTNFIEMLYMTGSPICICAFFFIMIVLSPIFVAVLDIQTKKISKNVKIKHDIFIQVFLILPMALLIWDLRSAKTINPNIYASYLRILPWKTTLIRPNVLVLNDKVKMKKTKDFDQIIKLIEEKKFNLEKKPNIFIFIIESLRDDYITDKIAPYLSKFKKQNISFDTPVSNANATHLSWFSIFYSSHSFYWKIFKDCNYDMGSPALNLLKKMGYKINIFSAPELKYYSMEKILFGKNHLLANLFYFYPHYYPIEAYESDQNVFSSVQKTLKKDSNIYISFIDSTHFLYSWPKEITKFKNYCQIDDMKAYASKKNVKLLENRYKNSIFFVDNLLKNFEEKLIQENLYDDSIIVILGDHGEEFYEMGKLFHASHLSSYQTTPVIYFKFPYSKKEVLNKNLVSHMDIFPSIIDFLTDDACSDIFDGQSIFRNTDDKYVISARYNASRTPYEFFIHNGEEKLTLRFKNQKNIFLQQKIEIVSLTDKNDKDIEIYKKKDRIKNFKSALEKLFNY